MKPTLPAPSAPLALGGHESRATDSDHDALRLWLRLLACSTQIETEIRKRLRSQFGTTLPRFDYLAQLHRHPEGLRMNALSQCLMVTGGSITGLTDQLERDGQVQRENTPEDRRAFLLKLTPAGRSAFERMATEHERWVVDLLGGLSVAERQALHGLLGRLRMTMPTSPPPTETHAAQEANRP
jgi:DNA-binding MarR family transcriptional regulator